MIFRPTTSIKETDCPLLKKGVKRAVKTVTLKTKMLVINNYGTNCYNLDMLIKELCEVVEVGLANVGPVGITEVLESHSQPLFTEELYDLVQQLTEQQKEDKDEENRGTQAMQTKDFDDILSTIDMAAQTLCDIDPNWECSSAANRGLRAMLHPYYEILQENEKKSKQLMLHSFLVSSEPWPGPSSAK